MKQETEAYGPGGDEGGCSRPKSWATQFFWAAREKRKFGQSQFLKTSPWLFDYFEDLNINLKSA